jgi:hypothetical protein
MNLGWNKQLTRLGRYSFSPAGPDPSSQAGVRAPPGWAGASSPGVGHPAPFPGRASAPRPPSASWLGRCLGPLSPPGWATSALPGWAGTCAPARPRASAPAGPACLFSGWAFLAARAPAGPTIRLGQPSGWANHPAGLPLFFSAPAGPPFAHARLGRIRRIRPSQDSPPGHLLQHPAGPV